MGSCEADGGCSAEATAALAGDGSPSPGSDLFNAVVMCMMNLENCGPEKYACWVDSACSSVREMPTDTDAEKEAWQAAADGLSGASRAALDAVGNCECSFDPCCGCHAGCPEGDGGCHETCDALCTGAAATNANGGSCRLREEFRHAEDCADIVGTPQMPSPCHESAARLFRSACAQSTEKPREGSCKARSTWFPHCRSGIIAESVVWEPVWGWRTGCRGHWRRCRAIVGAGSATGVVWEPVWGWHTGCR